MGKYLAIFFKFLLLINHTYLNGCDQEAVFGCGARRSSIAFVDSSFKLPRTGLISLLFMQEEHRQLDLKLRIAQTELKIAKTNLKIARLADGVVGGRLRPARSETMRTNRLAGEHSQSSEPAAVFGEKIVEAAGVGPRSIFVFGFVAGATVLVGAAYLKGGVQNIKETFSF